MTVSLGDRVVVGVAQVDGDRARREATGLLLDVLGARRRRASPAGRVRVRIASSTPGALGSVPSSDRRRLPALAVALPRARRRRARRCARVERAPRARACGRPSPASRARVAAQRRRIDLLRVRPAFIADPHFLQNAASGSFDVAHAGARALASRAASPRPSRRAVRSRLAPFAARREPVLREVLARQALGLAREGATSRSISRITALASSRYRATMRS